MNIPIEKLWVSPRASLREVIQTIQRGDKMIALVVNEQKHLLGIITDYDIRRAVLNNVRMDVPASDIMRKSFTFGQYNMIDREVFELMRAKSLRHLPLLDEEGVVTDLACIFDIVKEDGIPAVVMAGGFGQRLRPLTKKVPKPMLLVGDRPLLEIIVQQLKAAGIHRVYMATHYKKEQIIQHFGDGSDFSVEISYLTEDEPLGTAGILSQLKISDTPLLVINGDILTQIDFQSMLAYHLEHNAEFTVGVRKFDLPVPYGVLECEGPCVLQIREKPTYSFFVNAGIYLLQPSVHCYIPKDQRFDMTDLIDTLIAEGRSVVSFPIVEYWLDIGQHDDYQQAQEDLKNGKFS